MIFVTVGTNEAPFDRLLRAVERLPGDEELVVQHGSSSVRPANATCIDYFSYDSLVECIDRARTVVMHAGVGSIILALAHRKQPIVVPRLKRFHEAVDDHQIALSRRLGERGIVRLVEDLALLPEALTWEAGTGPVSVGNDGRLSTDLRSHLATLVAGRR